MRGSGWPGMSLRAQVNLKGSAQVNGSGQITSGTLGNWVIHYTYDALGRLIRSQRRISTLQVKTERFFYDGIRRVQETSGTGAMVQPLPLAMTEDVLQTGTMPAAYRHYIYHPDYVDHFVAQVDNASGAGNYEYMLQDSSYDVVSLVNADGVVLQQYGFDPYGLPLFADGQSAPKNRVGHHGLFFDRLDSTYNATQLTTGARGLYQVRNRTYDPKWQVWMQRDPNASGQRVLSESLMGTPPRIHVEPFDERDHYEDGFSEYCYLGTRPIKYMDTLGLSWGRAIAGFLLPTPSDIVRGAYQSLIANYAANQNWDVDWAADWSLPDEMHTRLDNSWIGEALKQGAHDAFEIGIPFTDIAFNPLDLFAGAVANPYRIARPGGATRLHGSRTGHFKPMVQIFRQWRKMPGVTGLLLHKAIRGKSGVILRGPKGETLLPDVQMWYRGKLHIWEVVNTHADPGKQARYLAILRFNGIAPSSVVFH